MGEKRFLTRSFVNSENDFKKSVWLKVILALNLVYYTGAIVVSMELSVIYFFSWYV